MSVDSFFAALGLAAGFLAGVIGHEYAHARVADRLGDKTPRFQGRLTLKPGPHIDPVGTVVLPAIFVLSVLVASPFYPMFGFAKPVPYNTHQLRNPKRDRLKIALAGPAVNLAVGAVAGLVIRSLATANLRVGTTRYVLIFFTWVLVINSFLLVVNLLPIPPLDGSKIVAQYLSPGAAYKYEELGQYGLLFLLLFFLFPPLGRILIGLVNPVCSLLSGGLCA